MNRQDVSKLEFLKIEPRGQGVNEKFWVEQAKILKLVKISPNGVDQDVMEYLSYLILDGIGINCVKVQLGYDQYSKNNCCLIDSFLTLEGDVSYEMPMWKTIRMDNVDSELHLCIETVFQKYASLYKIKKKDLEQIKKDYIRILLGKCITNNFDSKLENIGLIYNEKNDTYRLPPSFDNGFSFKDYTAVNCEPICFVGNQLFSVYKIIDYILKYYYDEVEDIIDNLNNFLEYNLEQILKSLKDEISKNKQDYIRTYLKNINLKLQERVNRRNL